MESQLVKQEPSGGPTISFLKTPPGITMFINFIMLMISWCIMAYWKGNVIEPISDELKHETGYFLFCTVFPWLLYIVFFIVLILQLDQQLQNINWPLLFVVNCILWGFMLFIAACVIAGKSTKDPCDVYLCHRLKAATAFGFLTSFVLFLQAYFHYREHKAANQSSYGTAGAV